MTDRPRLRLLHTADVHIGDDTDREHAAFRLSGLRRVVDIAVEEQVDALLIAGDFFDNPRVKPERAEEAWEELARLSVPILLTPGNHDCLDEGVYERVLPGERLPNLIFLGDPEGGHAVLPELRLSAWARGLAEHHLEHYPLHGYRTHLEDEGYWQIGLAHGHYIRPGCVVDGASPIFHHQIEEMRCDYLALGHWHAFTDVSGPRTPAFYAGSPTDSWVTYASANLVTLDPGTGASVARIPTIDDRPRRD